MTRVEHLAQPKFADRAGEIVTRQDTLTEESLHQAHLDLAGCGEQQLIGLIDLVVNKMYE